MFLFLKYGGLEDAKTNLASTLSSAAWKERIFPDSWKKENRNVLANLIREITMSVELTTQFQ